MDQSNPFLADHGHSPHGSINRLPLVHLPGLPLAPELVGMTAYPALSGASLEKAVRGDWNLVGPSAQQGVAQLGRLFGHVLVTLLTGPPEVRRRRVDWGEREWTWWKSIEQIYLAGGAFRGKVGRLLLQTIEFIIADHLTDPPDLLIPPQPELLPLSGAWQLALRSPTHRTPALALDWGQTSLKAAILQPGDTLKVFEPSPMLWPRWEALTNDEELREAKALHKDLLKFTVSCLEQSNSEGPVTISLANYIDQGVINPRGAYGKLRLLAPDYSGYFSQELERVSGQLRPVIMANDGVCASAAVASHGRRSALILWGTALGVGWPQTST